MKRTFSQLSALLLILFFGNCIAIAQCADSTNIYSFTYGNHTYEVIKENKTWADAALCAVERGGILAEINDSLEQNAIFIELSSNSNITNNNTIAPDGGGGAYVWLGGNDLSIEGNWVWNGNNDSISNPFWLGTSSGSPVGGLYSNWGNEPDDFNGQDALGISLNGWPLGTASQWNDVDETNTLYYLVEYSSSVGVADALLPSQIELFPVPTQELLTIQGNAIELSSIVVFNAAGQEIKTIHLELNTSSTAIDVSDLTNGVFFIKVTSMNGKSITKKFIK